MAPLARTPNPKRRAPLYDIHPLTGLSIEALGFSPDCPATGPFATSYAAYRHAMKKIEQGKNAIAFPLLPPCFPRMETTRPPKGGLSEVLLMSRKSGAGEGIRTLDPDLGKVVLYP
jgi:hypothetical protein